jgi:hypothetical protein
MEHRKDSSGRANAERERDDRDGRDERSSEKRADGELETAHKALDEPITAAFTGSSVTRGLATSGCHTRQHVCEHAPPPRLG